VLYQLLKPELSFFLVSWEQKSLHELLVVARFVSFGFSKTKKSNRSECHPFKLALIADDFSSAATTDFCRWQGDHAIDSKYF